MGCLTIITPIHKTNGFNLKDIKLTAGFVPGDRGWLSRSEWAPESGMGAQELPLVARALRQSSVAWGRGLEGDVAQ